MPTVIDNGHSVVEDASEPKVTEFTQSKKYHWLSFNYVFCIPDDTELTWRTEYPRLSFNNIFGSAKSSKSNFVQLTPNLYN